MTFWNLQLKKNALWTSECRSNTPKVVLEDTLTLPHLDNIFILHPHLRTNSQTYSVSLKDFFSNFRPTERSVACILSSKIFRFLDKSESNRS
ncbi:hypothetical protein CDAR_57321 [Caerostris darwini]|uniref:Uncharacterized protein n=1 Tax=Caerostris darwini TaxID=1538125 RepID=A0AAV4TSE7_9ARAC|nr:hypothetical protein CDAR_57321 [Caerostris darwini]